MRLGGPVFIEGSGIEEWVQGHKRRGYRAAYAPLGTDSSKVQRNEYAEAAREADITIAEVGAWSNPLSADKDEASEALKKCIESLRLADDLGAGCCVNISGNAGSGPWDGPSPENLTQKTFRRVVETTQRIIDEAAPEHASYCLETMPWMYPHTADTYLELANEIDRERFGVHFDPVNLINSPEKHLENGSFIRDCVDKLGSRMLCVHLKDQTISAPLTLTLHEARPGTGGVDYDSLLRSLDALDPNLPVLVEHLKTETEYDKAVAYIRSRAQALSISL